MDNDLNRTLRTANWDLMYRKMKDVIYNELVNFVNLKSVSLFDVFANVSRKLQQHGGEVLVGFYRVLEIRVAFGIVQFNLYNKCSDDDKMEVIDILTSPTQENQLLNWRSYQYLSNLLQKMDLTDFKRIVFPSIESTLSTSWNDQTFATLYLLMVVQGIFPECVPANFLENSLGTSDILCPESLDYLCQILMTIPKTLDLNHPIFEILIKKLSASAVVEQFFTKLDLVTKFDDHSKYVTFTILLTGVLKNTKNPEIIPNILTTNYLEQLIPKSMPKYEPSDPEFCALTRKLFDILVCRLKKKPKHSEIVIKVLRKLVFAWGDWVFFENECGNAVDIIVAILTVEGIKELVETFKNIMFETSDECRYEMELAANFLMKVKDYPIMYGECEWQIEFLIFAGKVGLLKDHSNCISEIVAMILRAKFYDSLYYETTKYHDFENVISKVHNEFVKVISGGNWDVLRRPLKRKAQEMWQKATEIITNLDGSCHDSDIVVHYLCSLFCLQLLMGSKFASDCLSEVFSCYESTKNPTDFEDEKIIWLEIVDLFLTLLSHDSCFTTHRINYVFPIVCKYIDSTMLHQILYLLDPDISNIPVLDLDGSVEEEQQEEEYSDEEDDASVNEDELMVAIEQESTSTLRESIQYSSSVDPNKKAIKSYRIRVLSLLEIYLKLNPSMLLTLEIMSNLMRFLQFCVKADPEEQFLSKTVRECLKLLPFVPLNESKDVTEEFLVELLTEIFYIFKLGPVVVQKMSEAIVDCSIYVLNCSQHLSIEIVKKNKLHELMEQVVKGFFIIDSDILYDVLKELFGRSWNRVQVVSLLPILFNFVFAKYSCQHRDRALKLAKLFFENRRYIDSHLNEMKTIEKDIVRFLGVCVQFFRELSGKPTERKFKIINAFLLNDKEVNFEKKRQRSAKDKFTCDLLQLLCDIKTSALGRMFQIWPILTFEARYCAYLDLSQDARVALGKFCGGI